MSCRKARIPKRSHHTESLERLKRELGEAKGTPLSVWIALGSPKSLKMRSKTANARLACLSAGKRVRGPVASLFEGSPKQLGNVVWRIGRHATANQARQVVCEGP